VLFAMSGISKNTSQDPEYVGPTGHEKRPVHQTHFGGYSDEYQKNYDRIFKKKKPKLANVAKETK
jgi:hypothetical protein